MAIGPMLGRPVVAAVVGVAGAGVYSVTRPVRPLVVNTNSSPKKRKSKEPLPWHKNPCPRSDLPEMRHDLPVLADIRAEIKEKDVKRSQFYGRGIPYSNRDGSGLQGRGQ